MNELEPRYSVTSKDLAKGRAMKITALASPFVLSIVPVLIFTVLFVLFGTTPSFAITLFSLGVILAVAGFIIGLVISGIFAYKYSGWLKKIRERISARGIRAEEIEWFKNELTPAEKKSLKKIGSQNLLLADAFRETLASRLTATRIIKSSKQELLMAKKRQNKMKYLKSENSKEFQDEIKKDIEKLSKIEQEAKLMRDEAETRLHMIEAAASRGTNYADNELALKKLSARTSELPLALEAAKMEQEIRRELEKDTENI